MVDAPESGTFLNRRRSQCQGSVVTFLIHQRSLCPCNGGNCNIHITTLNSIRKYIFETHNHFLQPAGTSKFYFLVLLSPILCPPYTLQIFIAGKLSILLHEYIPYLRLFSSDVHVSRFINLMNN